MKLIPMKRGDTFALNADITDANEQPVDYIASQVRSQVRAKNDELITTLSVQKVDEIPGRYVLMAGDTSNWPIGTLYMDIEINNGEAIMSSSTIEIPVVRDITRNE